MGLWHGPGNPQLVVVIVIINCQLLLKTPGMLFSPRSLALFEDSSNAMTEKPFHTEVSRTFFKATNKQTCSYKARWRTQSALWCHVREQSWTKSIFMCKSKDFHFLSNQSRKRGKISRSTWILQDTHIIKSPYYPPTEWHHSEMNADCAVSHSRQKENLDVSGC